MKTVSVVIPAYNEEKYIENCLKTLLNQTHTLKEIIIIDDGSTDSTVEKVKELILKNSLIKLLYQKHGGPGRARNLGVRTAEADIVVLVDADMEFHKDYIKNLVSPIIEGKVIGTSHLKEYVANKDNIWARCWGIKRIKNEYGKNMNVFRAILRQKFLEVGGFDPETGTFDDQTLAKKLGMKALGVKDAICYHNNPTTLNEVFHHIKWIGGSFIANLDAIKSHLKKQKKLISSLLFIISASALALLITFRIQGIYFVIAPLVGTFFGLIYLSSRRAYKEKDLAYLYALPVFYTVWAAGFLTGLLKQLYLLRRNKGYTY